STSMISSTAGSTDCSHPVICGERPRCSSRAARVRFHATALRCSRSFSNPMSMARVRRTRTIERRRRELQTPTRGFIRPARGQPVVLHAVRPALVVTSTLALLAGLVAAGSGCSRHAERPPEPAAGPQLVVRTVAAPDAHYSPDEYVQLTATRVHVSR